MSDEQPIDPQLVAALRAFSMAYMNGIVVLASRMRGSGLLDDEHVQILHDQMSLPLAHPRVADNVFVPPMQDYIDQMFATLLQIRRT